MLGNLFKRLTGRAAVSPAAADAAACVRAGDRLATGGELHAALVQYRRALAADPACLAAQLGIGNVMVDLWMLDGAIDAYAQALALAPQSAAIRSALLFHRHYASKLDAAELYAEHCRAGDALQAAAGSSVALPIRGAAGGRRLRIGYVSPNFSRHSVGYFIEPVIRHHDRSQFEIFCYYTHPKADDVTARFRAMADAWRDVPDEDGAELAARIRTDGIDVLVDLAGHSKLHKLAAFAHRPAPLQLTWLGYPDTSGLPAMDARIVDAVTDPAPQAETHNREALWRMAGSFLCYQPPADSPPVGAMVNPAASVVFCSFNNIAKLNAATVRVWSAILNALPGARLIIKSAALNFGETAERVLECFEQQGVAPGRVELRGWVAQRAQHLSLYVGADIALDTFPYNGTTTTCEALWMGVPVVTQAGDLHMARVGASLLQAAGLGNLVARDEQSYINIAVALANDETRRRALRTGLRARLEASPLLDHAGFTRRLEQRYRDALSGAVTSSE